MFSTLLGAPPAPRMLGKGTMCCHLPMIMTLHVFVSCYVTCYYDNSCLKLNTICALFTMLSSTIALVTIHITARIGPWVALHGDERPIRLGHEPVGRRGILHNLLWCQHPNILHVVVTPLLGQCQSLLFLLASRVGGYLALLWGGRCLLKA